MAKKVFRYVISFAIVIAIMVIPIKDLLPTTYGVSSEDIRLVAYLVAYFIVGTSVLKESMSLLMDKRFIEYIHMISIVSIGLLLSGNYGEAVIITILYNISVDINEYMEKSMRQDITKSMDYRSSKGTILVGETKATVNVEEIKKGNIIYVKPGEMVPLDGVVTKGVGFVDLSLLTGDGSAISVNPGSTVISGAYAIDNPLEIKVTKDIEKCTLTKLYENITDETNEQSDLEYYTTRISLKFMVAIFILAIYTAIFPPVLAGFKGFDVWVYRALGFLVVTGPVAFCISIPISILAGIGNCMRNGVMVKGGKYIEALAGCNALVLDYETSINRYAKKTIDLAKSMGIKKLAIITDENDEAANKAGLEIGIPENAINSNLSMKEMAERIKSMSEFTNHLLFIGGLKNDILMSRADIGAAIGYAKNSESEVDYRAANVIAMDDNPLKVVSAINIAYGTIKNANRSIKLALLFKIFILFLLLLGIIPVTFAMIGEVMTGILVMFNTSRLLK